MGASLAQLKSELSQEGGNYFHAHGSARFANTLETLLDNAPPPAAVLDIGGDKSDYEKRKPENRMPYSFGKYFRLAGYDYTSVNASDLDARTDPLPFADNQFEVVTAWEIIEHLWTFQNGGLLTWHGPLHFWREAHRVLAPGGVFFCATRNRWCPLAFWKMAHGFNGGCYAAEIEGTDPKPGHAREWTATELEALADITGTYPTRRTLSRSSALEPVASEIDALVPAIENLIGRKFLPEEKNDSVYFLGTKKG